MPPSRLATDAAITMALILASRLLGFVRERAVAEVFGRTAETDAFNAAFNIPDLMYFLLVGGALSAAFIPVFTRFLARQEEEEAWRVASTFFNGTVVLLVLFTLAGMAFTPLLAPLVAYDFTGEQRELLIRLMRMMFPAVLFTALAGLGMGVHNAYRHFQTPILGPIFYNIAITLGAYLLGPRIGIVGMAVGTVLGAAGNFLIQLPFVLRKGWGRYRLHFEPRHPAIREMGALMLPAIVGLGVAQLNLIVTTNLASTLPEGSVTALRLSNRLMQFPLGVFAMGISTVVFPTLTRQAALGETEAFVHTFGAALRNVLFVTIPSAVGLAALRVPVVRLLFEAGQFGPEDTEATAYALLFFSLGLISQSAIQILVRVFYSVNDTRTPVRVSVGAFFVNTGLSLLLLRFTNLGHGGLALAFSVSSMVNWLWYLQALRRRVGRPIGGRALVVTVARSLAASVPMALAAVWASELAGARVNLATFAGRSLQVAAGVSAGAVLYALAALALRVPEARYLLRTLAGLVNRRGARRGSSRG